jgi:hypothetical protein
MRISKMSDVTNFVNKINFSDKLSLKSRPSYKVEDTHWGYIVSSASGPGIAIIVAQAISMIIGAALVTAVASLSLIPPLIASIPTASVGTDDSIVRTGVSVIFAGVGFLFLWYASRGTATELQIDTNLGEIREVVRNRGGRSTLLGRYGFDSIGGVFLNRTRGEGDTSLVMRYRNTAQTLLIASGTEESLLPLRNRLGRDLLSSDEVSN